MRKPLVFLLALALGCGDEDVGSSLDGGRGDIGTPPWGDTLNINEGDLPPGAEIPRPDMIVHYDALTFPDGAHYDSPPDMPQNYDALVYPDIPPLYDAPPRLDRPVTGGCKEASSLTHTLPSPPGMTLWATSPLDKVLPSQEPPAEAGASIAVSAALREFEPFQVVVRSAQDTAVSFAWRAPEGGVADRAELFRVETVWVEVPSDPSGQSGHIPDALTPLFWGETVTVPAGRSQAFWVSLFIPDQAPSGDHQGSLAVHTEAGDVTIPVDLHIFAFALPERIAFKSQMNVSFQALGGSESLERVEELKAFFHEHRMTPKSVAWPAGLNYNGGMEYDCAGSIDDEDGAYGFAELGPKYIDGVGWNGVGFPSFMAFTFVDNSTPRPAEFCGQSRGDHYGTAAYNGAWELLLSTVDQYIVDHGYADKAYYYVMNEPQGQDDYDLAAYLADMTHRVAPHLRIAVSEEPKGAIAEHPGYEHPSYDIWIANLSHYDQDYAWERQAGHGEEVWWYFLYGDRPPLANPLTIDHPAIEGRIIQWLAWRYRIDGMAYYSLTGWGEDPWTNPRPQGTNQNGDGFLLYPPLDDGRLRTSIRLELMREGLEDYEYLVLAGGGKALVGQASEVDRAVDSVVSSLNSWTKDGGALMELRRQLGCYIGGERTDMPVAQSGTPTRPRGDYYINFQDPAGEPRAEPLVVAGHEYIKVGWMPYDEGLGYGWYSENLGTDRVMYTYIDAPVDERQRSIIYDDWGREATFEFDIEPGAYRVTVSAGWAGRTYSHNRVIVEGVAFVEDEATTPEAPYLVRTREVQVTDGKVTLEMGIFDEYTMLNYMDIEAL